MDRPHTYGIELSRLRNLSNEPRSLRKIHFRLDSDTLPTRESYLDLYVPEFHQCGPRNNRSVRHLDVTSTWRGLSIAHAHELKFWEDMFAAVLEYTISNHMIDLIDTMDDCNVDRFPGDLDSRICAFVNKLGGKTFTVNVREIITCMLELYKRHGTQHQWLASSGNIYNALCEFLRTRDCFLDTPLHPTVKVTFTASLSGIGEPSVLGVLKRFGPLVAFNRLDSFTTEDVYCRINPCYTDTILDRNYPSFLGRPEYRLSSDWIKFDWDAATEGFKGYVRPIPTKELTSHLRLDLTATSQRFFPRGVKLERVLRVRIKLSVCHPSRVPTVSLHETLPSLKRCESTNIPAFPPLTGLKDLSGLMRESKKTANVSSGKPSPSRKTGRMLSKQAESVTDRKYVLDLLRYTKPDVHNTPVQVNQWLGEADFSQSPVHTETWGKNVPAWATFFGAKGKRRHSSESVQLSHAEDWPLGNSPMKHPALPFRSKRANRSTSSTSWAACKPSSFPPPLPARRLSNTRFKSPPPCESSLPPEYHTRLERSSENEAEYVVVQPVFPSFSRDPSGSDAPVEMKPVPPRTPRRNNARHHRRGRVSLPQPPATAPAVPKPVLHARVDSVLGIRHHPHHRRRRPSSAIDFALTTRPRTGSTTSSAEEEEEGEADELSATITSWLTDLHRANAAASSSSASASASASAATTAHAAAPAWDNTAVALWDYAWPHDTTEGGCPLPLPSPPAPPNRYPWEDDRFSHHEEQSSAAEQARAELRRREMREWYDAMLLQHDTPRRRTREERSDEEAFAAAFLGSKEEEEEEGSGVEGDADGEDEDEEVE